MISTGENNERTIRNIVALGGFIYVYFSDPVNCAKFLHMADEEGLQKDGSGSPMDMHLTDWLRVYKDGTLSYVQTNGRQLIQSGIRETMGEKVHRIDFDKYINGEKDYSWRYIYRKVTD